MTQDEATAGKTYELCGEKTYSMEDLVKLVNRVIRAHNPKILYVPSFILRALGVSAPRICCAECRSRCRRRTGLTRS